MTASSADHVTLTPLGGPTVLLEMAGARLLVDPTFDPAGEHANGPRVLTKTSDARFRPEDVGALDAVLLSHDQHADNLDELGRALLRTVPLVLTTAVAAGRLDAVAR
ncbi:MAG: MBL fold metallo-hydrolase, partial [Microbacterium sp.]